ncbi:MAG: hypothetical protein V2A54_15125 [Bacteroidota bacterium]
MKLEGRNIVIVSNEPWGDIWYSKHNWAYELSRKNKIIFVNPPTNWKPSNFFNRKINSVEITANLSVISYRNKYPSAVKSDFFFRLNEESIQSRLKKYFSSIQFSDFIFWSFDPLRLTDPKSFGATYSLFHCVDDYKKEYLSLCSNVNSLILVSRDFEKKLCRYGKDMHIIPHGISEDEFVADPPELYKHDLPSMQYGLYVGNLDPFRIDYALIEQMLIKFPDIPFVFVGRQTFNASHPLPAKLFLEKKYPNLIYIPPVHFKQLKNYISNARFCIAPMVTDLYWNVINHHKILQYLAMGKPVFTPVLNDYDSTSDKLYMYKKSSDATTLLENYLKNGEEEIFAKKRISFAHEHTYGNFISKLENLLTP